MSHACVEVLGCPSSDKRIIIRPRHLKDNHNINLAGISQSATDLELLLISAILLELKRKNKLKNEFSNFGESSNLVSNSLLSDIQKAAVLTRRSLSEFDRGILDQITTVNSGQIIENKFYRGIFKNKSGIEFLAFFQKDNLMFTVNLGFMLQ